MEVNQAAVVHACNSSTWEAEAGGFCEFVASLDYRTSSRTGRNVTQRNPVSKPKNQTKQNKNKNKKKRDRRQEDQKFKVGFGYAASSR